MAHSYISLPIELGSDELISSISRIRTTSHRLITYVVRDDTVGFSTFACSEGMELICQSEEEFHTKISHEKLMRIL